MIQKDQSQNGYDFSLPCASRDMLSINELPENVLLELFSLIPARELLRHCRPVCSLWRDVIDLVSLWKRKCQREGFISENCDQPVADWKVFYFLCSLRRNLLRNPCAQEGFKFWKLDENHGNRWKVEKIPRDHGTEFPDFQVKKCFVTSYGTCLKSQLVDLKAKGYWKELMDKVKPDIVIKDWFAARRDCGCIYRIHVKLLSATKEVLAEFNPAPVYIEQWSDAEWQEVRESWGEGRDTHWSEVGEGRCFSQLPHFSFSSKTSGFPTKVIPQNNLNYMLNLSYILKRKANFT
uniref:F-box protein 6 n=1 Tax=Sarcophilus harrisii TaxID=9305 RepID=A0A7N4NQT1_SARHA